ncbi:long-chain-fatty-acid--CoA ligase [Pseudooceanicola aestuarii]|uniref:long-chain-fatty-acid--CoA ligase n=1 Tax=Pseudooceanicola aestuarii TaxID=2697319 RepID=UPI0013D67853|nr:long-chain-fatty-acid--CoA ligase [Pseudooceanicola aestuarii]
MPDLHLKHWPEGVPHHLELPEQSIAQNLVSTAARVPDRVALRYHGGTVTYAALLDQVERLAGWLQAQGVAKGDRVLLYMQNAPQYFVGYYAILRADAVVVPVNPMNREAELEHLARDTGARIALCGSELADHITPLLDQGLLDQVVPAAYADMADPAYDIPLPAGLAGLTDSDCSGPGLTPWRQALAENARPGPHTAAPDDLCVIPYSSGTTGNPKGCVHTHRSAMVTIVGGSTWNPAPDGAVHLATLPLFHVTGMQNSMSAPIKDGGTVVIMSRWDRTAACKLIERYRVERWRSISTMAIDLVNAPDVDSYDLTSLTAIGGGGAAMPEAVAEKMRALTGLDYIEGYGLSETLAATHINPVQRAHLQCLGIPLFDVDSRVIDPHTLEELGPDQPGEIIMNAPQIFQGYWRNPEATTEAFIQIDGKRFFRTGDIALYDEDGYYFMVDRVKRMINASGFKVWPAEVEALMHRHPGLAEVCIVGRQDPRRGESVKAFAVRLPGAGDDLTEAAVIAWCKANMAAYKCPRTVEFVDSLPKSGSGKVLWRTLAEQEARRAAGDAA